MNEPVAKRHAAESAAADDWRDPSSAAYRSAIEETLHDLPFLARDVARLIPALVATQAEADALITWWNSDE